MEFLYLIHEKCVGYLIAYLEALCGHPFCRDGFAVFSVHLSIIVQ